MTRFLTTMIILLVTGLWSASVGWAENVRPGEVRSPASKFCDPVCNLKSQDAAFALLMETFRQHRSYQVEADYQIRLLQISNLDAERAGTVIETDSKVLRTLKQFVLELAKQERDLKMAALETKVANLESAYGCARKIDEAYVGQTVPKNLDREKARTTLTNMVAILPGTIAQGNITKAQTMPSQAVLANPPIGPAIPRELVEPCE